MSTKASQITSLTIFYPVVYSGTDQWIHQSSASLAFVRGIHRWPVNSLHKGPVTQKVFTFEDVIMILTITTLHCHIWCGRSSFLASMAIKERLPPKQSNIPASWGEMLQDENTLVFMPENWWKWQMELIKSKRLLIQKPCKLSLFSYLSFHIISPQGPSQHQKCRIRLTQSVWKINSLRPGQNRRYFADYTFKCIFLKENDLD